MSSSPADAFLYYAFNEQIDSSSSPVLLYDPKKDEKDFPNEDALRSALLLTHAFCCSEDSVGSLKHVFYSELTDHFSEMFKAYSIKVQLSQFAR